MDEKAYNYRKKHPQCRFCKHLKHDVCDGLHGYYFCEVREKIIEEGLYQHIPRLLCKEYEVRV